MAGISRIVWSVLTVLTKIAVLNIKRGLTIKSVSTVDEVLAVALMEELKPLDLDEVVELDATALTGASAEDEEVGGVLTH